MLLTVRRLLLIAIACTGCSLDAGGTADNGALVEDSGTIVIDDSAVAIDSTVDDTPAIDSTTIDSGVADSAAPDTTVADTMEPDTQMPDTADTAMPDTADTALPDTAPIDTGTVADTAMPCMDPGGVIYGGHCYFPLTSARTWTGSRDACVTRGAHLVTISNSAEQAAVETVGTGERWIGLVRSTGSFGWLNGETSTYRNWDTLEPNGSGNCARMVASGRWRDDSCDTPHPALCERDSL
jgi:hypothetical protein